MMPQTKQHRDEVADALLALGNMKAQRDAIQEALSRLIAVQHLPNQHPDRITACANARAVLAKVAA